MAELTRDGAAGHTIGLMAALLRGAACCCALLALAASAGSQSPSPSASPSASPSPSPSPAPLRPISESVDRAVQRALVEHGQPCLRADQAGLPCFPTSVEAPTRGDSVAEALQRYRDDRPTAARVQLSPNGTPIVGVGFDPFCAAKSLVKAVRGRNDTYYLYRLWNRQGEHAVLRDRPIELAAYGVVPDAFYEFVDRISGECEAVAAWRKANREAVERNDRSKGAR